MANFSVYSLADTDVTLNTTSSVLGKMVLSDNGGGRISWTYSGDMSNITTTANGYAVINRLISRSGSISLEIPVNSPADLFLRKWIEYIDNKKITPTSYYARAILTVVDNAARRHHLFTGVVPQKRPDENYDQAAGMRQYNLFYAELESKTY